MTLSCEFEAEIQEDALDDWDVFDGLCHLDMGEMQYLPQVVRGLLGEEQLNQLKKHIKDQTGKCKATDVLACVTEIITNLKEAKK